MVHSVDLSARDCVRGTPVARRMPSRASGSAIPKRRHLTAAVSEAGEDAGSTALPDDTFQLWDKATNTLTACSTVANLLMMMPQVRRPAGRPKCLAVSAQGAN